MLRTIYFYGAAGAALTFLDPVKGSAITAIPVVGDQSKVIARAAAVYTDTPVSGEFANIKIGSEGDYHDLQLFPRGDGNNITAGLGVEDLIDLGDFEIGENEALSGTAPAGGAVAGALYYDDMEPEIGYPEGRTVFLTSIASGDLATALAVTNIAQPNATKPLSVNSMYYVKGAATYPEDQLVQAMVLKNSDGRCACALPKGRIIFPSCPLVIDGNDAPSVLGQVAAAAKASVIWELIEVPKSGKQSLVSGAKTKRLMTGGSLRRPDVGSGVFGGFNTGGLF